MKSSLVLCLLMASLSVLADDLMVIHGGREIHGRVLEENETSISFYTDYGKKIQVHKSRVSVLLRNGEILAVNPPVGNVIGIQAENDISNGKSTENSHRAGNSNSNEPVTLNNQPSSNRQVATSSSSETTLKTNSGLRVGAILGMTQSNASTSTSTSNRTGAEGGLTADYPLASNSYLQSGFLLSQAGWVSGPLTVKYNYLKIPILFKYKKSLKESFNLTAQLGPSFGFRTQGVSEVAGVSTDIKSTTKSMIYGLDLGAGGEYLLSSKLSLFLNLNYSMQLNNLDSTIGGSTVTRLRQLSFLTGFLFSI